LTASNSALVSAAFAFDTRPMSVSVETIEKGGSGRKFWRVSAGGETMILVRYTEERPENRYYVSIGQFLAHVGVRVPKVFFHDEREGVILMEDAGGKDLWSHRGASWPERRALYQRTLDQALILHTRAHSAPNCPHLQQEFNAALYQWEQDYFIEHCLGRHFGIREAQIAEQVDRARLAEIAGHLASQPRCLVHRDFQSQNVIVRNGEACLIDFQGLRPGLAQYDLASLLLDPYVDLTPAERDELLAHYLSGLLGAGRPGQDHFLRLYDLCAMQRLMQALGAYGKLGHVDGRAHFLQHIPTAIARLHEVLERIPGLAGLRDLLGRLRA
jgi:aminoglycoside/choline kinase family phosphotransferase